MTPEIFYHILGTWSKADHSIFLYYDIIRESPNLLVCLPIVLMVGMWVHLELPACGSVAKWGKKNNPSMIHLRGGYNIPH